MRSSGVPVFYSSGSEVIKRMASTSDVSSRTASIAGSIRGLGSLYGGRKGPRDPFVGSSFDFQVPMYLIRTSIIRLISCKSLQAQHESKAASMFSLPLFFLHRVGA